MSNDTFPRPIAADAQTVTLRRADWDAYVARMEDASDIQAVRDYTAWVGSVGPAEAKRLSYTSDEATTLLDGGSAVSVWRRRAGLSQRALAAAAGISPSYLAEIEGGKKPGSAAAIRTLARVLNVPMEMLVD